MGFIYKTAQSYHPSSWEAVRGVTIAKTIITEAVREVTLSTANTGPALVAATEKPCTAAQSVNQGDAAPFLPGSTHALCESFKYEMETR